MLPLLKQKKRTEIDDKGTKRRIFIIKASIIPNDHEHNKTSTRPL